VLTRRPLGITLLVVCLGFLVFVSVIIFALMMSGSAADDLGLGRVLWLTGLGYVTLLMSSARVFLPIVAIVSLFLAYGQLKAIGSTRTLARFLAAVATVSAVMVVTFAALAYALVLSPFIMPLLVAYPVVGAIIGSGAILVAVISICLPVIVFLYLGQIHVKAWFASEKISIEKSRGGAGRRKLWRLAVVLLLIVVIASVGLYSPTTGSQACISAKGPKIVTVSPILPTNAQSIYITGCGFTDTYPTVEDHPDRSRDTVVQGVQTPSIGITDNLEDGRLAADYLYKDKWCAGMSHAPNATWANAIGVYIQKWSDNLIVLKGFGSALNSCSIGGCWDIRQGDIIRVYVIVPIGGKIVYSMYRTKVYSADPSMPLLIDAATIAAGMITGVGLTSKYWFEQRNLATRSRRRTARLKTS
jgi:hypothetical protein